MRKYKNNIRTSLLSILFICLCSFSILQAKSQSSVTLECNSYLSQDYSVVRGDKIIWSFSSTQSEISVIVLTESQKNTFYNMYLSAGDYIILSGNLKEDSGTFTVPFSGSCYIYFVNWGMDCEETQLTYETTITRTGLITWIVVISGILAISVIVITQRKKNAQFRKKSSTNGNQNLVLLKKFQKLIVINPQIKLEVLAENLKISESQLYDYLLIWKKKLPIVIQDQRLHIENMTQFQEEIVKMIAELE